ncbi:tryptophan synthase subunit alpha [Mucisphaera sp.]|uniref:tryptophan synthase subunit alpha n=1 Tax=Mucisphaera sp. TaxID=2913024 RepID=UPI003D0D5AEF
MNRIERIFSEQAASGGRALMPFLTAGDPSLDLLGDLLLEAERSGAHLCEVGIPFSDPIADGPVIQASMTHALRGGVRVDGIFEAIEAVRAKTELGLVAMVSYSIVHRYGLERFVKRAKAAGFDGLIFPDLALEASGPAREAAASAGLTLSLLIAPTTGLERATEIAAACTGFGYIVARSGITGEQLTLPEDLTVRLAALAERVSVPRAVGFGVSSGAHVRTILEHAEGVIVGSALVRRIAEQREAGREAVLSAAGGFIRSLAEGLPETSAGAGVGGA